MRALPLEYACGLRFGVYAGLSRSYSAVRWGPRGGVMAAANKDPEINAKQARRDQPVQHQGRQMLIHGRRVVHALHGRSLTRGHATYPSCRVRFELAIRSHAVIDPEGSLRNRLALSPSGGSLRSLLCCCGLRAIELYECRFRSPACEQRTRVDYPGTGIVDTMPGPRLFRVQARPFDRKPLQDWFSFF